MNTCIKKYMSKNVVENHQLEIWELWNSLLWVSTNVNHGWEFSAAVLMRTRMQGNMVCINDCYHAGEQPDGVT